MDHSLQEPDDTLTTAAESLFRLGRLFSRLGLPSASNAPVELSRILVVQAVATLHAQNEITVGAIAQQLAVEASTASRLVAETIKDGFLVRSGSPIDNRRALLALTDAGSKLAADARAYQVQVFRQVTSDWTEQERNEFARLFVQFAEAVGAAVRAQATRD